ncbi:hypothetical protein D9756_002310 [Leucocoprinus leucothites]|uniref:Uncharacterized protein n=1 Tax=Leucocoprinus leucothites TaxID=201217 RepID=A0A8H5GCM1_9AGAR|nr:hypothetical protein D9756_002310 [Leucoagaricus leucothites]
MLCSVLTLRTRDRHHFNTEDAENDQWPGSTRIFFYHASFLEFLCDRQRSMEYWILDQRHYSDISLKALRLLNEMYTMNHIPRGEKLQKLSRLLSVFPDKTFSRAQRFKFRNKLFYDFLCRYTLREWCAGSDLGPEILGELREAKLVDLERPEMESGDEVKKNLPHDIAQCLHKEANNYWSLPVPHYSSERNFRAKYPDASADVQKIWTFVESVLFSPYYPGSDVISKLKHLIRRVCKNSECSQYIQSQMTKRFSSYIQEIVNVAKEQKFETMNNFTLLSYYAFAWYRYEKNTNFCELVYDIPETITRSALLPWDDFFLLIQGDGDRLGQAALRLIKRQRDGDLFPIEPLRCSGDEHKILEALCRSLGYMSANDIGSGLQCEERLKVKLLQDTQTRYTAERLSLSDCAFLSYLENVFDLIMEENSNGRTLGYYWSPWFNESTRACAESLMEDRWSEMYTLFGELLDTDDDKNVHLQRIVQVAGWSPDGQKGLKAVFRAYVKQNVLAVILEAADDAVSPHLKDLGVCASAFLAIKQQEKVKAERIGPSGPFFHNWGLFRSSVDEALAEVLNEYPQLHEPVRELQVQQEARAKAKEEKEDILQQKSESETKEDQLQEPLVTNTEGSKPELSQDTTSPETDRGPRNRDRIRTFFQGHFKRGG